MHDVLRASQVRGLQEKENMAAKRWSDNKQAPHELAVKSEIKGEKEKIMLLLISNCIVSSTTKKLAAQQRRNPGSRMHATRSRRRQPKCRSAAGGRDQVSEMSGRP